MQDLTERIAALPEYGNPAAAEFDDEAVQELQDSLAAALARLALAREWIKGCAFLGHHWNCEIRSVPGALICNCGRDALLKALRHEP